MAKYSVIGSGSHQPSQGYLDSLSSYLPSVQGLKEYLPDGLKQYAPFCSEGDQLDHEGKDVALCVSMEGYRTSRDPSKTFLLMGYNNGLQVYDVSCSSSMMVELLCHRGEPVKCAKMLPHPSLSSAHQTVDDAPCDHTLDELHPLVAVASTEDSSCASKVQLLSLRSKVVAQTLDFDAPVRGLDASASVLVVALHDHTLQVFGARNLRKRFHLTSYPNPTAHAVMALGSSWLAYPYAGVDSELQWHGKHQGLPISTTFCEMTTSLGASRPDNRSGAEGTGKPNFKVTYSSVTEAAQGIASLTATGASILGKALHETYSAYNEGANGLNASSSGDMLANATAQSAQKSMQQSSTTGHSSASDHVGSATGTGVGSTGVPIDRKTRKHEGAVMVIDVRNRNVVTHFDASNSGGFGGPAVAAAAKAAGGVATGGVGSGALHSMNFSPSGMLLATCTASGQNVLVYRLAPTPRTAQQAVGATVAGGAAVGGAAAAMLTAPMVKVELAFKLVRGITHATIIHLRFSDDSCWVAASTSRGTTHLYIVDPHGRSPTNVHARVQVQVEGGSSGVVEVEETDILHASGGLALSGSMRMGGEAGRDGATSAAHVAGTGVVPAQPEAAYMGPHRKEQQRLAEESSGGTNHLRVGASARLRQPWPPLEPERDEEWLGREGLQDGWGDQPGDGVLSPVCTDMGVGFNADDEGDDFMEVKVPVAAPAVPTAPATGNPFANPAAAAPRPSPSSCTESSSQPRHRARAPSPGLGQMDNVAHAVRGVVSTAVEGLVAGSAWRTPFVSTSTFFGADRRLFVAAEPGVLSCYALHANPRALEQSSPPLTSANGTAVDAARDVYVLSAVRHWDMRRPAIVEEVGGESGGLQSNAMSTAGGSSAANPFVHSSSSSSGGDTSTPPLPPAHQGKKKGKKNKGGGGAIYKQQQQEQQQQQQQQQQQKDEEAASQDRISPTSVTSTQGGEVENEGVDRESTFEEWLAQAEIRTHSAPLVPLWAHPQIAIHVRRSTPSAAPATAADEGGTGAGIRPELSNVVVEQPVDNSAPAPASSSKKKKKKKNKGNSAETSANTNPTTTSNNGCVSPASRARVQMLTKAQVQADVHARKQGSPVSGGFELFIERRHYVPLAIRRAGPMPMTSSSHFGGSSDAQSSPPNGNNDANCAHVLGQGASPVFDGKFRQPADPVIPVLELSGNISAAVSSSLDPPPQNLDQGAMRVSNGADAGGELDSGSGRSIFDSASLLQDSYFGGVGDA
jgi:hypothetical protein